MERATELHRPRDRPPSTDVREESAAPIPDRVETESGEVDGIHCYRTMGVRGMRDSIPDGADLGVWADLASDERGSAGTVMRHDELLETHRITVEFSFTHGATRLGEQVSTVVCSYVPCRDTTGRTWKHRIPARRSTVASRRTPRQTRLGLPGGMGRPNPPPACPEAHTLC